MMPFAKTSSGQAQRRKVGNKKSAAAAFLSHRHGRVPKPELSLSPPVPIKIPGIKRSLSVSLIIAWFISRVSRACHGKTKRIRFDFFVDLFAPECKRSGRGRPAA